MTLFLARCRYIADGTWEAVARKDDAYLTVWGRSSGEAWKALALALDASLGRQPFALRVVTSFRPTADRRFSTVVLKPPDDAPAEDSVDRVSNGF